MMEFSNRIKEVTISSGTGPYIFGNGQIVGYDGFHMLFSRFNLDRESRLGIRYLATDNINWEEGVGVLSLYTDFYTHQIKRAIILGSSCVVCKRCGHITKGTISSGTGQESGNEAVKVNWNAFAKEVRWRRSPVELLDADPEIEDMQLVNLAAIYPNMDPLYVTCNQSQIRPV